MSEIRNQQTLDNSTSHGSQKTSPGMAVFIAGYLQFFIGIVAAAKFAGLTEIKV